MADEHLMSKWCEYCQKHGHTDNDCWCTRWVPARVWPTTTRPVAPPKLKPFTLAVLGTMFDITQYE